MSKAITLKDLAHELGLSVPTVSLALRNAGNVSKKTCALVQALAEDRGYSPNPYAAALSTAQSSANAQGMPLAIIRWPALHGELYPVPDITEAIKGEGAKLGYQVEQRDLDSLDRLPRELRSLYHQGVQGVFFTPVSGKFMASDIDWKLFSVVCCGRYDYTSPFNSVHTEIFETTRMAFMQCLQRGYKRVGVVLIQHDPQIEDDFSRLGALLCAQQAQPVRSRVPPFLARPVTFPSRGIDPADFKAWFEKHRPDAVIGFSSLAYYALLNLDLKIPEEVAFMTLHHRENPKGCVFTGYAEPYWGLGLAAVSRMDAMIRHHQRGCPDAPQCTVIRGSWVEGDTLPDINALLL